MLVPNRMLSRLQTEWLSGVLILIASVALSWTFTSTLYQLVLQCDCSHLWAGAPAHVANARQCPFCGTEPARYGLLCLGIALPQAWLSFRPRAWMWPLRLVAALLAFPVFGVLEAVALGLVTGYWR